MGAWVLGSAILSLVFIAFQDVAQKLSHMMWNDWDKAVRTAAAQALGRTGNGKVQAFASRRAMSNARLLIYSMFLLVNILI